MNDEADKYIGYIRDLAYLLREQAADAISDNDDTDDAFEEGRAFGLRQALAWMQHQADAFGIPRAQLCLAGFDALTGPVGPTHTGGDR